MKNQVVRVKGIPVELGGETYIVPPLSLGQMEQLKGRLANFTGNIHDIEQLGTVIDSVHCALRRNYPEVTREFVGEAVGLENMMEVFEAVMDVSGLRRKQVEAQAELDEAGKPEAASSISTT